MVPRTMESSRTTRTRKTRRSDDNDNNDNDNNNERKYDEKLQNMHVRRVAVDAVRATRVYLQRSDGIRSQGETLL